MTVLRLATNPEPRRRTLTIAEISLLEDTCDIITRNAHILDELRDAVANREPETVMRSLRRLLAVGLQGAEVAEALERVLYRFGGAA